LRSQPRFDDTLPKHRQSIAETLDVAGALAAIHLPHCAAIHPARLARGLAQRLEDKGAVIHEQSPVLECGPGEARTARGRVLADNIILATEGYGAPLAGHERRLIPVHSMMVATEPLPDELFERLRFRRRYCFGNLDRIVTYGQRTADNRVAFGCRGRYFYGSGTRRRFGAADPEFALVRNALLRFFPALRDVRFTHAWGGALGVSRSLRAAVCFDAQRRLGWAGGYFGNGVAAAHLAGRTLADLVLGRDSERLHTPWVNPPEAKRKWEPEPLRWLGFRAARTLMERADRAEYQGRPSARLQKLLDGLLG
jgi:glycine/D-amino acid oxidase-like deaminating enzyme